MMSKELKEKARSLLESGASVDETVKETGLKVAQVRGILGSIAKERKKKPAGVDSQEPPTLRAAMKTILEDYGYRKGEAVLNLLEDYGYSIEAVYSALRDASAPKSVVAYTLKRWASSQDLRIPIYIQKQIGPARGPAYPGSGYSYNYGGDSNTTRELRDKAVEIAKLQEKLRYEEEKRSSVEQDYKILNQSFQEEREKRMKAEHQRDLENVKSELREEINQKIGSMSSDLGVLASVVKEGTGVGKRIERVLTSPNLGQPQPPPQPSSQASPEQRSGTLQQLREKGLVTIVRDRMVQK